MDYNSQRNMPQTPQLHQTPLSIDSQLLLFQSVLKINISLHGLTCLIKQMQNEKSFPNRLAQAKIFSHFILGGLNNQYYHSSVITIISILSDWVRELKYELKSSYTQERLRDIERLISIILSICQHCTLTISELKSTKIGKSINKLAKNLPEPSSIKAPCQDIVDKWRKMADDKPKASESESKSKSESCASLIPSESLSISTIKNRETLNDNIFLGKKTSRPNLKLAFEKDDIFQDKAIGVLNANLEGKSINDLNLIKPKKSCIKKTALKQLKNKQVKFANETLINKVKIFKLTDEPIAPAVSDEEYAKIQKELQLDPNKYKNKNKNKKDMRKEDIKMDKPMKARAPMVQWKTLQKLTISNCNPQSKLKCQSIESQVIEDYCSHILSATYFTTIPEPKEGKSVLYAYEDESIPKIENSREVSSVIKSTSKSILATSTNPVIELFNYLEPFNGKEITLEHIQFVCNKLEGINTVSQEMKLNFIKNLCGKLSPGDIADFINRNCKQVPQNGYQLFPYQDTHYNQLNLISVANSTINPIGNGNSNNNNTTNDSYNSNDSIDNQEKRMNYNEINLTFNDKLLNMFNDKRQNEPVPIPIPLPLSFTINDKINYRQNQPVVSPPHLPFIQPLIPQPKLHPQQLQIINPFIFYPIRINSSNNNMGFLNQRCQFK